MIQIAVAGANGRIGQLVVQAIEKDPETKLAAKILRSDPTTPANSNTVDFDKSIDVIIDFSTPAATLEHLALARQHNLRMVIGTTGFSDADKKTIQEAAKDIPIILSPNMSIGVNISFRLLELAAQALTEPMGITISDIHHQHKKDAPSGTALKMAEIIKNATSIKKVESSANPKEKTNEKAVKGGMAPQIEFSSERIGNVVGDHSVCFTLPGESLEITHKASDRTLFAKGALLAAKWLTQQCPGLYDMQDVLGLRAGN